MKGEPGRDGFNGSPGISGPPGHIFMIPLQSQTTKGPDNAEALRAMLSQHMVRILVFFTFSLYSKFQFLICWQLSMKGPPGPQGLTGINLWLSKSSNQFLPKFVVY